MLRGAAATFVLVLAGLSDVAAARLVIFADGRALRVASLEFRGDRARLTLETGGEVQVPAEAVASVEAIPTADGEPAAMDAEPLSVDEVAALAQGWAEEELWREAAGKYADLLAASADRHGLDRALLAAIAKVESNFNPYAISPKGACGILQLMPPTARRFGVAKLFDPAENLEGGARYLRWLLDRFDGRIDLALAGYNAGEGAVERHGGVPPYRETVGYVRQVLGTTLSNKQAPH